MVKKFLLSTQQLSSLIDSKYHLIEDTGMSKGDILALIVEYIEYSVNNNMTCVEDYLNDNWLIGDDLIPRIASFVDVILTDIKNYCPELIDVLKNNGQLFISFYNKHFLLLEKPDNGLYG